MTTRIGINGFGRIGRLVVRGLSSRDDIEVVHINDPQADVETAAHLLQFDSVHGRYAGEVSTDGTSMTVDRTAVTYSSQDTPAAVPWTDHGVDIVLEWQHLAAYEALVPLHRQGHWKASHQP